MRSLGLLCCALLMALCGSAAAQAQYRDPPDPFAEDEAGKHEHDGFMFRVTLGPGWGSFTERSSVATIGSAGSDRIELGQQVLDVSGAGLLLGLDLGTALGASTALHARLSEMSLPDPGIRADGEELAPRGDSTRAPTYLGAALSHYLMPLNLYGTASVGLAVLRQPGFDGDTSLGDVGWGLNLDVGKEWWVSDNWGVGLAARYFWLSTSANAGDGSRRDNSGHMGGLLLSATYQ
ncbi:MAG: hypothetical protein OXT09_00310 [Myxococcales bacterium]|nr:hypothetical protein [Myxococcales bacterium]